MMTVAQVVTAEAEDPVAVAIRKGDRREAVALCARAHAGGIGRLCMAMLGSQAEAEEALQDTLIAAHEAFGSWRAEGTVRAWLFGIARRVCARRLEAREVRERRLRLVNETPAPGPDALVDAARRAVQVRDALSRITPTEREALLLRYEGDLSFKEIAQACGCDEATARKRASRGLERLRKLLEE